MSIIFGLLVFDKSNIEDDTSKKMIDSCEMWPHDQVNIASGKSWFLGCKQQYNTPQSPLAKQPISSNDGRYQLVFDGRIDNRKQIAETIKLSLSEDTTDEELIVKAYAQFGNKLCSHIIGDFAIAILDTKENNLFIIRDHMGVRPLFVVQGPQGIAFSSTKAALLTLPWVNQTPNDYWIADFITSTKVDPTATIYEGIRSLQAGHWLECSADKNTQNCYWQLELKPEGVDETPSQYVENFKELLREAVRCRLRSYSPVASEMSGGLDSTTVTATASNILLEQNKKIQAFSHVMPKSNIGRVFPFNDESSQMEDICQMHPNILHHPIRGNDRTIISQMKRDVEVHSSPSRSDLTLVGEELLSTLEENGIRTLLSGFGGDQMVTSHGHGWNTEYAKQSDWIGLWRELQCENINILRKISRFLQCYSPTIKRLKNKFRRNQLTIDNISKLMPAIFSKKTDYPPRAVANPGRRRIGTVREQEHDVIHSPHVVYRLEDSAVGAATYGVDYRYPLLDIRLMQYYLNLPFYLKVGQGIKRKVIREATIGLLPESIRMRDDKSRATIPTVHPRFLNDLEELKNLLQDIKHSTNLEDYLITANVSKYLNELVPNQNPKGYVTTSFVISAFKLGFWLKNK